MFGTHGVGIFGIRNVSAVNSVDGQTKPTSLSDDEAEEKPTSTGTDVLLKKTADIISPSRFTEVDTKPTSGIKL